MLCQAVLLVATCYGLAVSAAAPTPPTTAQIETANMSPQTDGLVRDLSQSEGKFLIGRVQRTSVAVRAARSSGTCNLAQH